MGTRIRLFQVCTAVMLVVIVPPVHAQWVEDGIEVSLAANTQEFVKACPDGEGGAILVWRDYRLGNFDIFAQRIDAAGNPLWTADGVPVCTQSGSQPDHVIVPDGAGGVIVVWTDYRSGINYDLYGQRLDSDGNPLWTIDGTPIVTQGSSQMFPLIATDGEGGAIISWLDYRGLFSEIYTQRINNNGAPVWTADGLNVTTYSSDKTSHAMTDDGMGGVFIVWSDSRDGNWDIYGMRIYNGSRMWASGGFGICTYANTQFEPDVINDGYGGMITAWYDYRTGSDYDIWAQRITYFGLTLWSGGGNPVCVESGWQESPRLIQAGEAGAIIAWDDSRLSTDEIYAQRIDYLGDIQWNSSAVRVCNESSDKSYWNIIADGEGGAILSWTDYRYSAGNDIYAQRLNASGTLLWDGRGEKVSGTIYDQSQPAMTGDGSGGAIIAWQDGRRNIGYDIFAQRIERNGYWGYPAPIITGIRDIPGDQGGQLNLAFDASRLDVYPENSIGHYTVWRAIDETSAMSMLERGAVRFEETALPDEAIQGEPALLDEDPGKAPVIRFGMLAGEPYYWFQVAYIYDSDYIDHYAVLVQTLFDSTGVSGEHHYFQVIAHESEPTAFWVSAVDSAYSVDNLAPAAPLALAGEQIYSPEGMLLTWDPNSEIDLAGYNIYRGLGSGFTPGPENFVTSTPDTMTLDDGWSWQPGYWYKVAAVDIHGNESIFAVLGPDMVTGDDPMPLPDATFLAQNCPNPFNPVTTIRFGIKESGHISIRIYDAAGRFVTTLVDESRSAGSYTAEWNGRGVDGRVVASGVYFYRLKTKEFEETKKMILLK